MEKNKTEKGVFFNFIGTVFINYSCALDVIADRLEEAIRQAFHSRKERLDSDHSNTTQEAVRANALELFKKANGKVVEDTRASLKLVSEEQQKQAMGWLSVFAKKNSIAPNRVDSFERLSIKNEDKNV